MRFSILTLNKFELCRGLCVWCICNGWGLWWAGGSRRSVCPHVSFRPSRVVKEFHLFSCFLLRSNFRNMRMRTEGVIDVCITVLVHCKEYGVSIFFYCPWILLSKYRWAGTLTHIILVLILFIMLICKLLHNFLMISLEMPSFWTWWSSFLVC